MRLAVKGGVKRYNKPRWWFGKDERVEGVRIAVLERKIEEWEFGFRKVQDGEYER